MSNIKITEKWILFHKLKITLQLAKKDENSRRGVLSLVNHAGEGE